jgi:hypothetical protein
MGILVVYKRIMMMKWFSKKAFCFAPSFLFSIFYDCTSRLPPPTFCRGTSTGNANCPGATQMSAYGVAAQYVPGKPYGQTVR